MSSLLFVCLGNICRSPLAEGIAKHIAREHGLSIEIDSAGTGKWHIGEAPCEASQRIALKNGIDISDLRARTVLPEDKERFEKIVAMDKENKRTLEDLGFRNTKLLGDYGDYGGKDVPDPYYATDAIKEVFTMIRTCVEDIFRKEFHV